MKTNKTHVDTKKLVIRIVCGVLAALMLASVAYYAVWGFQILFETLAAAG